MEQVRTRRRGAVLEQAILDAAWAELREGGWSGFSITRVADRCGTAKNVVYRRWDNRVELAQAVLVRALRAGDALVESSGDLRADLLQFLRGLEAFYSGPFGEVVRGVLLERQERTSSLAGPEVPRPIAALVDAAVARGELAGSPSAFVQNIGHALMTSELIHTAEPLRGDAVEVLVDQVWLPALRQESTTH
ncbi:MAG TPA: TetR/AcrR family transcriptional regulator [Nocardioides sp.]|uniref:TetR/AcrR family transcriptional regulator n=1 Tax=Nocardioides sp. TaxID=35761 RepID=UPI002BC9E8AD|nr:TetR/AcrR family transcriptional regulator [Nocardioides sp.]HTW15962.1 TetR/AcrR family transcriptional regulator [Nocardioides sp.]